jgi:hypothetical protein
VISSKTRNQILTGTSIAFVVAILTIDVYSSFKLSEASLDNQGNTTTINATGATGTPVGNTPFYSEHTQLQVKIQSMPVICRRHYLEKET